MRAISKSQLKVARTVLASSYMSLGELLAVFQKYGLTNEAQLTVEDGFIKISQGYDDYQIRVGSPVSVTTTE